VKFKIDENLPMEAATLLRGAGHDALTVHDQGLRGAFDPKLREVCLAEGRIPVTFDLDFSDLRTYRDTPGCILLRLRRQDRDHVLRVLQQILPMLEPSRLANSLWIVEEARVRIRESQP
jgi:predicted nuclease of predicted toxin-antitoxin system